MPLSHTQILELRANRAKLIKEANDLLVKAKDEKRDLSAQEAEQFDKLHGQADKDLSTIQREERQLEANTSIETRRGARAGNEDIDHRETRQLSDEERKLDLERRNGAIGSWLRHGAADMPVEQRQIMQAMYVEMRDQSAGTANLGGYTVAPDTSMYGSVVEGLKMFGFPEQLATIMETGTGAVLPIPTNDDTANQSAGPTGEGTDTGAATDLTFGQINLNAYAFTTGVLKVSLQFLQDTSIDAEGFIGRKLGERDGRKRAALLTTGTGTNQPKGIVTAANVGVTAASATAIAYNELLDLEHSVDPAHRVNASYMFHDQTLKLLKKLTDTMGRPLFLAGFAVKAPDTINGYPFVINQQMPQVASTTKSVLFGNIKNFAIRRVRGFGLQRLVERYAEFLQVGFVGFSRYDSNILDAGTHPISVLQQAA